MVIAREIVEDIVRRKMAPGTALPPESSMVERFAAGRASLREALRILEVNGLISIKPGPGGGPVVQSVSSRHFGQMATLFMHVDGATFRELVEARLALEPMMARWAATRRSPESLERLEASLRHAAEIPLEDPRRQFEAGADFHAVLVDVSGNRVLNLIGRSIADIYAERITGVIFPVSARTRVNEAHAAIVAAIRDGDADRAEELTRAHMVQVVKQTERRYPGFLDEVVAWH